MWDRLFGRGKQDEAAEPTCANCGRTLLPGEWAQTVVRDDGTEEIVCSLCSQSAAYPDHQPAQEEPSSYAAADYASPADYAAPAEYATPAEHAASAEYAAPSSADESAQAGYASGAEIYGDALDDESAQTAPHDTPTQFYDAEAVATGETATESGTWPGVPTEYAADQPTGGYDGVAMPQDHEMAPQEHDAAQTDASAYDDSQAIPSAADYGMALGEQTAELPPAGADAAGGPWTGEPASAEPGPDLAAAASGAALGAGLGDVVRDDSEAFWQALRDKDAEIARLQAEIMRLEAERRELSAQVSRTQDVDVSAASVHQTDTGQLPPAEQDALAAAAAVSTAQTAAPTPPEEHTTEPADATAAEGQTAGWEHPAAEQHEPGQVESPPLIPADEWARTPAPEGEETAAYAAPEIPGGATADYEAPAYVDGQPADVVGYAGPEASPDALETAPSVPGPAPDAPEGAAPMPEASEDATTVLPPADMAAAGFAAEASPVDTPTEPLQAIDVPGQAPLQADQTQAEAQEEWCPVCDTADLPGAAVSGAPLATPDETGTVQMDTVGDVVGHELVFETDEEPPDLHRLQRAADLFNVSDVPGKVAETNELLGPPAVHLTSEDEGVTALLMWSMAWYEYSVDLDTGDVKLLDRGYDDRSGTRPNASARPDGTIQPTPVPTRRPIVKPVDTAAAPVPAPAAPPAEEPSGDTSGDTSAPQEGPQPEEQRPIDGGKGDIISKSLKGKRTDDETVAWDEMAARDFDWGQ